MASVITRAMARSMARQTGELELLDELFLQGLAVLVAEIAAAVVVARPGGVRGAAGLLAPGLVGDLHLRLFALVARGAVAVELRVLFLGRVFARAIRARRRAISTDVSRVSSSGLEHDIGLEGLPDMRLQVERGELQQPNRLLQLRRHGELLADAKLQTWLQHFSFGSKPTV